MEARSGASSAASSAAPVANHSESETPPLRIVCTMSDLHAGTYNITSRDGYRVQVLIFRGHDEAREHMARYGVALERARWIPVVPHAPNHPDHRNPPPAGRD
ncbi:unnamed protein product [Urochloa humidicola]